MTSIHRRSAHEFDPFELNISFFFGFAPKKKKNCRNLLNKYFQYDSWHFLLLNGLSMDKNGRTGVIDEPKRNDENGSKSVEAISNDVGIV